MFQFDVLPFCRLTDLFANQCQHCGAYYWKEEQLRSSRVYTTCCNKGSIQFQFLEQPNPLMQELFTANSSDAKLFRKNIRKYNTALAFAACLFTEPELPSRGPPVIIVRGNIMHKIGSLHRNPNQVAAYMQCYFHSEADGSANPYFRLTPAEVYN